jgi:hypothetical protein
VDGRSGGAPARRPGDAGTPAPGTEIALGGEARLTEVLEYREVFEETYVFGDLAVEWGHIGGSERNRSTGEVTTSRFHVMRILKRGDDRSWRVHRSVFAPASSDS